MKNFMESPISDLEYENLNCPECHQKCIVNNYQKICSNCGLIVEEEMIHSNYKMVNTEEYQFNHSKQYVSVGKTLETVGNLGTYIDFFEKKNNFKDINGNPLNLELQNLFSRLKNKYSKFSKIKNEETDYRIMNILADVIQYMKLNQSIRKDAAYYFRKIKNNNSKIRNNISLIAFCIFFAVRNYNHNAPVTIKEISDIFQSLGHRVNPRLIIRDGVLYKKILIPPKPHKSEDYITRLIDNIVNYPLIVSRMSKKNSKWSIEEYRMKLYNETMNILKKIDIYQRGGRNPFIFAGAAIYCADKVIARKNFTKCILTQKIASESMKIAEYSIRDHYVSVFKKLIIDNFSN